MRLQGDAAMRERDMREPTMRDAVADEGLGAVVRQLRNDGPMRPGCPISAVKGKLREAGLRPTRQRVLLGWLLFGKGHRHVSAETLYDEVTRARGQLSLATVYNTLRQFTEAGLLRQVHIGSGRATFDTDISDHHHFVVEGEDAVIDISDAHLGVQALPEAPPGFAILGVDIVVRLKRIESEP
jgi:Fur family iron response transcriptional regulator